MGEEEWQGQEFTKHRPPLAPKLPKQAASGGRCFVECLPLQMPIDNLGKGAENSVGNKPAKLYVDLGESNKLFASMQIKFSLSMCVFVCYDECIQCTGSTYTPVCVTASMLLAMVLNRAICSCHLAQFCQSCDQ